MPEHVIRVAGQLHGRAGCPWSCPACSSRSRAFAARSSAAAAPGARRWHDDSHARCPPLCGPGRSRRRSHHLGSSGLLHRRCSRQGRARRRQPPGLGHHRFRNGRGPCHSREEITFRRGNPVDRRRRGPARPRARNPAARPRPGPSGSRRDQRRGSQDPEPLSRPPLLRGHPGLLGTQRFHPHRHDRPAAWLATRQQPT